MEKNEKKWIELEFFSSTKINKLTTNIYAIKKNLTKNEAGTRQVNKYVY